MRLLLAIDTTQQILDCLLGDEEQVRAAAVKAMLRLDSRGHRTALLPYVVSLIPMLRNQDPTPDTRTRHPTPEP